jgi:hypothetical protein
VIRVALSGIVSATRSAVLMPSAFRGISSIPLLALSLAGGNWEHEGDCPL